MHVDAGVRRSGVANVAVVLNAFFEIEIKNDASTPCFVLRRWRCSYRTSSTRRH